MGLSDKNIRKNNMYLAMVETNSNQAYIFSTQRQRDHIGASWLISQVPKWFDEFCEEHKKKEVFTKVSGKVVATFESKEEAHEFGGRKKRGRKLLDSIFRGHIKK